MKQFKHPIFLLIYTSKHTLWKSCFSHQDLLITCYKRELSHKKLVILENDSNAEEIFLSNLSQPNSAIIIFLSPQVNLSRYNAFVKTHPLSALKIIFHLYGDFLNFQSHFLKSLPLLKKYNVQIKFLFPSQRLLKGISNKYQVSNGIHYFPLLTDNKIKTALVNEFIFLKEGSFYKDKYIITYAGRIEESKNLHLLIKAFSKLDLSSNCLLVIAGEFEIKGTSKLEYLKKISRTYQKLPEACKKNIIFVGKLSQTQTISLLKHSNLHVNLSRFQGEVFGFNVQEANLVKTPSLVTNWGGLPEQVNDKRFIINLNSKMSIAAQVETVCKKIKIITKNNLKYVFEKKPNHRKIVKHVLESQSFLNLQSIKKIKK